jgi:hypothetical protein
MLLELTVSIFVAAYIAVVVVGHVLLFAAIFKCLRDHFTDGRPRRSARRAGFEGWSRPVGQQPAARRAAGLDHRPARASRDSALRNFAEQREALSRDLRYVIPLAGRQC